MFGIQEIDSMQLAALMESEPESFLLLDVRGPNEMAQGMLPNAEAMPMHLVPLRVGELKDQQKIVVYCRSGVRSAQICAFLQQQGIDQCYNLRGGIIDWYQRGYPIEAPELSSRYA